MTRNIFLVMLRMILSFLLILLAQPAAARETMPGPVTATVEKIVDGDTLVFSTPENQPGTTMHGRRVPSLTGFVFIGKDGDRDFHLGLTPGECSDGMSDRSYPFTVTLRIGPEVRQGCGWTDRQGYTGAEQAP